MPIIATLGDANIIGNTVSQSDRITALETENTALKQSLASATARLDSLESRLAAAGI